MQGRSAPLALPPLAALLFAMLLPAYEPAIRLECESQHELEHEPELESEHELDRKPTHGTADEWRLM